MNVLALLRRARGRAAAMIAAAAAAVVVIAVGASAAAAHSTASLPVPEAAAGARPAPHILDFARDLRGPRLKLPKGPHHVAVAWNVDGCDHDYGTVNQCVPWTIPAPAGPGCAWLAAHGFGPLKVKGRDRQNLDTNGDGIACDQGDAGA